MIFRCVLVLFLLFFFDVPSSLVSMLVGGPVTSSLTRAFLIGITSDSFIFAFPLASSWITFTALSPACSGNGGIAVAAYGGRLKICG